MAIDELSGDVWISNAKDFVQKGEVYNYSSSGILKQRFDAGVGTTGFLMVEY